MWYMLFLMKFITTSSIETLITFPCLKYCDTISKVPCSPQSTVLLWEPNLTYRRVSIMEWKRRAMHVPRKRQLHNTLFPLHPLFHSHVWIYCSTERCEADTSYSSGLGAGFRTENASRDTSCSYAICKVVLRPVLKPLLISHLIKFEWLQQTPSMQHSVPANMAPTKPKFLAELKERDPISLNPLRSWSRNGRSVSFWPGALKGVS